MWRWFLCALFAAQAVCFAWPLSWLDAVVLTNACAAGLWFSQGLVAGYQARLAECSRLLDESGALVNDYSALCRDYSEECSQLRRER